MKDRIALRMIEDCERARLLRKGNTLFEVTAGNTGIGLAMVASLKGYHLVNLMVDKFSGDKVYPLFDLDNRSSFCILNNLSLYHFLI